MSGSVQPGPMLIDRKKVEATYPVRWWGQNYICQPRFVESILGDGRALLALQPLNTRPHYYLIRIDSSWHLDYCRVCGISAECPDDLREHLDEIYEAIEDEYGNADSIRYENKTHPDEPLVDDSWPVFDDEVGTCWWLVEPTKYRLDAVVPA